MAVVNVTPDSFSDGGRWFDADAAVTHGHQLIAEGADILDVGGESTRPGAARPDETEELRRILPVVTELASAGARVSVDTMRSRVAAAALEAGASLVNDVSGGLADPDMARVVADARAPYVAMHWRGHSKDMQSRAVYGDVVADVRRELEERVEALLEAGVRRESLIVDPGFGFAKTTEQNWEMLARLTEFERLGLPLLAGTSRKSFLSRVGSLDGEPLPPDQRDEATAATSVLLAQAGVWGVRVHEVRATAVAFEVLARTRGTS
ncbi:dihydropteroate synthase [Luteipulveratus mongoliensis]|uniref:Dihydropteroate synthase n=2 Tax=Luteipulveratus mongoliensis TaxID=571913 RepID=A0A0K1JR89_9MICO|nr:dihydropteroate synthase [Luteipulveratus mongoliensis]AKU19227.1 dihydropteroate synthase [Luteipulveratus mongoliensis]